MKFPKKTTAAKSGLDEAIESVLVDMQGFTSDTEEYAKMADQLVKLYALKDVDRPKRVSPDTWATVGGSLAGIVVIVGYEHAHVVTSKALNLLPKLR